MNVFCDSSKRKPMWMKNEKTKQQMRQKYNQEKENEANVKN
jgi:hypothetical protein